MKLVRPAVAVGAIAMGIGVFGALPSATAAPYSGCVWNAICNYYSPSQAGSSESFTGSGDKDLLSTPLVKFGSAGAGKGQNVGNNAASAWNTHDDWSAVYYSKNWTGAHQEMGPLYSSNDSINLNATLRNNNRSLAFPILAGGA